MATHTLCPSMLPKDDEDDICGEEKTDGSICERDPEECPYHG